MGRRPWHSDRDPGIEMRIAPSQPTKNIIASIQSMELKYSITPNLDFLKKLDFCK
jgi:hypothetical protein